jgi:SH3-like domain-containing protein
MGPLNSYALEELQHHWGEAYIIMEDRNGWRARRKDGKCGWIVRPTAEELFEAIREDYGRCPVPRQGQ